MPPNAPSHERLLTANTLEDDHTVHAPVMPMVEHERGSVASIADGSRRCRGELLPVGISPNHRQPGSTMSAQPKCSFSVASVNELRDMLSWLTPAPRLGMVGVY